VVVDGLSFRSMLLGCVAFRMARNRRQKVNRGEVQYTHRIAPFVTMGKFLKPGKVVLILSGKYAGKKALIVKTFDEGNKEHPFPHALVAGIARAPRPITKKIGASRVLKKSKIKPFIKIVNYNHIMPTRYTVTDLELKSVKTDAPLSTPEQLQTAKKGLKKEFENRYLNRGKNSAGIQFFYQKLRF